MSVLLGEDVARNNIVTNMIDPAKTNTACWHRSYCF